MSKGCGCIRGTSECKSHPENGVDLGKAQKGDKVKFRSGGEAVIKTVERSSFGTIMNFEGKEELHALIYDCVDGSYNSGSQGIFDIIAIEPAPFDWANVRPGMAFAYAGRHEHLEHKILRYIGKAPASGSDVFEVENGPGHLSLNWLPHREELSRASKHDLPAVQP